MHWVTLVVFIVIFCYFLRKINSKKIILSPKDVYTMTDDVTNMNARNLSRIFDVHIINDIKYVIKLARQQNKKISICGQRHTMGGQTIAENGYQLDMQYFNHVVKINKEQKLITVEPGITWCEVIRCVDSYGLSPMTLQSYSSFSVGGTISVNGHGITNDYGVYNSVESLKIINCDGKLITCSRTKNSKLFSLVLGGYGLFGVICRVTLRLVPNTKAELVTYNYNLPKDDFETTYLRMLNLVDNDNVCMKMARINVTNPCEISLYVYNNLPEYNYISSKVGVTPNVMSNFMRLMYKWLFASKKIQRFRYFIEKVFNSPLDWADGCERNQMLYESADSISKLYNPLIELDMTHILQEYFIPNKNFDSWMEFLNNYITKNFTSKAKIKLLNITIRYVKHDTTTYLNYAKEDMFAFVFYYRLPRDSEHDKQLECIHNDLVNKTLELDGTFYLPYRHHYSKQQMEKAYPNIGKFFTLKKLYDPTELFSNMWYVRYEKEFDIKDYKYESDIKEGAIIIPDTVLCGRVNTLRKSENKEKSMYHKIMYSAISRKKLHQFLQYVFFIIPTDNLYNCIFDLVTDKSNDKDIYNEIQKYVGTCSKIKRAIGSYNLLSFQKELLVEQTVKLLHRLHMNRLFNGYVHFGDCGRYIDKLRQNLMLSYGSVYVAHNSQKNTDIIERGTLFSNHKFVQFDYTYVNDINIPDASTDLITIYIGLHHFTDVTLNRFLKLVHRILRCGGLFIVREHHGYPKLIPLLHIAHSTFNAVTGETLETDISEVRNFRPLDVWRPIVEGYGFTDTRIYEYQQYDPTENYLMCFIKN